MTESELIQILRTVGNVREEYDQDYERIIRLRSLMEKVTTSYGKNSAGGSGNEDKLASQYCALEELQSHCREREEAYLNALKYAMDIIELADSTAGRKVLKAKYIDGMKWDDIARIAHYSNMHCHRLHDLALQSILEKM